MCCISSSSKLQQRDPDSYCFLRNVSVAGISSVQEASIVGSYWHSAEAPEGWGSQWSRQNKRLYITIVSALWKVGMAQQMQQQLKCVCWWRWVILDLKRMKNFQWRPLQTTEGLFLYRNDGLSPVEQKPTILSMHPNDDKEGLAAGSANPHGCLVFFLTPSVPQSTWVFSLFAVPLFCLVSHPSFNFSSSWQWQESLSLLQWNGREYVDGSESCNVA